MSDPRFARLKSDPRFRRPRRKHEKLVLDDRFKRIFTDESIKKTRKNHVDKYGRPVSDSHEKDNLRRFYRLENQEEEAESKAPLDYARGEFLLDSSDDDSGPVQDAPQSDSSDPGRPHRQPISVQSDPEVDLDETNFADLDAQAAAYDKRHTQIIEQDVVRTRRLAVVNLDWEHVRATHLFKICSSLVLPTVHITSSSPKPSTNSHRQQSTEGVPGHVRGRVLSVRVYPSEFGKERMKREENEGPPPEIFKRRNAGDEEEMYDVGSEDDYDSDALRKYQLERLRYYYAVITCDTVEAATHIYMELDGTELERSANVFDLSYVPDEMTFDDECRDEATDDFDPAYKGIDFVTDALRHSKVKLTWDEDDQERSQVTRRTLTHKEIDHGDFSAYLASSESPSESEAVQPTQKSKSRDLKASRDKLRALLLEGSDHLPEGWVRDNDDSGDVDMEITFTPGLSEKKRQDETTLETYQRKMKEKRQKRKETKGKDVREKADGAEDDFFDVGFSNETATHTNMPTKIQSSYSRTQTEAELSPRLQATPEELAVLVASSNPHIEPKHFNLKSILKADKKLHQRGKQRKTKHEGDNEIQADFKIDVNDDRFKALHEDPQFAIDPTNPHFKKTTSMNTLLQERSKRQKELQENPTTVRTKNLTGEKGLSSLVESVKRKSATARSPDSGKRKRM